MAMMRGYIVLGCGVGILLLLLGRCGSRKLANEVDWTLGEVRFVEVEGGFYGIVTDDGRKLDPLNLADGFKQDGLRIRFTFRPRPEVMGFHQWGQYVEVVEVERVE